MKELNGCRSNEPVKKHKTKSKKHKPCFKYFVKNSWPKVMISRDNVIYKKAKGSSCRGQSSGELRAGEEKVDYNVRRGNCDENEVNFEEGHGVCLISSSSEIQGSLDMYEEFGKPEGGLGTVDEPIRKDDLNCTSKESDVTEGGGCSKPVFVDLTTEKKRMWKHSILRRYRGVKKNVVNEKKSGNGKCVVENVLESRTMIADSSSKSNCNRTEGPATALRNRGTYLMPMQPNRSLPIHPAPSVPTRSFQKRFSPLLILPKFTIRHAIEVESPSTSSSDEVLKGTDLNTEKRTTSDESVDSMDYVIPQISSVETLAVVKKGKSNDAEHGKDNSVQEHKRRGSQEADSSQNKIENSINEFLTNFYPNRGARSPCSNKCATAESTTKEETGNKLVPPLRLKKISRTKLAEATDSKVTAESDQETNYRIIRDKPLEPPSPTSTDDMFYETETDLASLNTDSHKLKYRRNKLKEKLSELRSKALELSKQMANEADSQQNTSLRQVMNRYEKQIENLSKLHSKLSAAIPEETINSDDNSRHDDECTNMSLKKIDGECINNDSPVSSPEPPKLSPRSPICYDDRTQEIRNSPPILPKVCLATSSSEDTIEEMKVSEAKTWLMDVDLLKPFPPVQSDVVNENNPSYESLLEDIPEQPNTTSIETNNPDFNELLLNTDTEVNDFSENKVAAWEETNESNKLIDEFPCHDAIHKPGEIKSQDFFNDGPVIKSVSAGLPMVIQDNQAFTSDKQLPSLEENTLEVDSNHNSKINDDAKNLQNVTSSTGQPTQFNVLPTVLSPRYPESQPSYKAQDEPNTSTPKTDNPLITEQFPSLSNWLAGMSRKQTSKVTSQSTGNLSFPTTNTKRMRTAEPVVPEVGSNVNNGLMNAAPQGTERWLYQRLLQPATTQMTLPQPVATVPPLRSATYPAIPVTQFYMNNYAMDPYNGTALNYHPPIFSYGSYPYHSRLHSNTPTEYHYPVQESLRPAQQMDKRFPLIGQEPVMRYAPPSMNTLQHPNNLEFDRLRGSSTVNNIGTSTCVPPSLFPSPNSPHQGLRRDSSNSYPTSNQFSGNRMNVVAAAAAAAVVAAASIDRQYDTLGYNRTDRLPASGITNSIDERSSENSNKSTIDTVNRVQDNNEEIQNNGKYKKMLKVPFDRLCTKPENDFVQASSINNNSQPMVPTTYQMLLNPSYSHLPGNVRGNEVRNTSTPHLGRMDPNLYRRDLVCSNCGSIVPQFKCLGCEKALYCDERCQEKHWSVHIQRCPTKMPNMKKLV